MVYHFPKISNVYFLAIISTVGGMLFGFDISSMSAIIGTQQYVNYFNNPQGIVQGGIGSALAGGTSTRGLRRCFRGVWHNSSRGTFRPHKWS